MSTLLFLVTHKRSTEPYSPCLDCGANPTEQLTLRCPGAEPEEGTYQRAVLDEAQALKFRDPFCECGGSSLRDMSHSHWCPSKHKDTNWDNDSYD